MTSVAPCPYLPGKTERKVFANLPFSDGAHVNDEGLALQPGQDDADAGPLDAGQQTQHQGGRADHGARVPR